MKRFFLMAHTALFAAKCRQELVRALAQDHELYCLAPDYDAATRERIRALGAVPLDDALNHRGLNPLSDILAAIGLARLVRRFKPDIVLALTVKPVIFGAIAARAAGTRRIVGMLEGLGHGFVTFPRGETPLKTRVVKRIQVFLYKIALPRLDLLVFLNRDDKADLLDRYRIRVRDCVILGPTGVDLDAFRPSPAPTAPVAFAFVGRLLTAKGIFEYLRAAQMVKARFPDTVFHVFGAFDDKNPFAPRREDLEPLLHGGAVRYEGFADDMPERLARVSVFVLPSWYREGCPLSAQEAAATGRPVITAAGAGCRETVVDGVNGFLVPPGDAEALAERMARFAAHPELVNAMGKRSRAMAEERFDIHKTNARLVKLVLGQ